MSTLNQKLLISGLAAVIFVIVSLSWTYKLTNTLLSGVSPTAVGGCPTTYGLFVHTLVFFLLVLGSMYVPWDRLGSAL